MSTPWDILQAVKTVAEGLGHTVKIRKRPFFSADHGDTLPMLCLSLGAESTAEETFKGDAFLDWPLYVVYFQAKNSTLESSTQYQLQLDTREALRLALSKASLAGVSTVRNYRYDASPPFDLSGLDNLFDISCQLFTYRTAVPRSN